MRLLGALLLAAAAAVGAIAALWTAWRALGAEVDYCPVGGWCSQWSSATSACGCCVGGAVRFRRRGNGARMLSITPAAAEAIREIRETNELDEEAGLRITARLDGEDVAIELDLVDGPAEGDEVVEDGGARVFLDPESAGLLTEVELDVEEHGDHVHFEFSPRVGDDTDEA